jgi:NTE family protein
VVKATSEVHEGEAFLRNVPLFADLSEAQRARVLAVSTTVRVPAGGWLFREGDAGDALYVVRTGRLEVVRDDIVIRVLSTGSALGELALLTEGDRSASVRARRETEVLKLGRDDFLALLEGDPAFAVALTRTLGQQLQRTTVAAAAEPRSARVITILPLQREMGVVAGRLANGMLETLRQCGLAVELLRGVEVDASADMDLDVGVYGRLLDRCERSNDHVLLLAEGSADPEWDDFCLRQADRVIGVVDPMLSNGPGPRRPPVTDLATVNRVPRSSFIGPWLDAFKPQAHHQVDPGPRFETDTSRIARRLAGRSVGLVLSGGGARGLAHVGVFRALAEAGVVVDRLGGTSMGSMMAGLAAMGLSPDEMQRTCRDELALRKPFSDYTVPRHALIKARRAEAMLMRVFGHRRIEELDRPFFAISADLLSGEEVVHRRGPVAVAVGISMCLPGLVPPVVAGPQLLVDGGVLNNLPVDVMADAGEGPIIAVDVMRKPTPTAKTAKPASRAAAKKVSPFGIFSADDVLPSLVDTLARSTVLGSWRRTEANRGKAALVVVPELSDVGLLEFRRLDSIAERGYTAAVAALATADPALWRT